MDGDRAVFIAQNGIDLLRVLPGDAAQRIAVIAADAVGDIAAFKAANADHFAAREVAGDGFNPFRQQGAAAFENCLGRAGVHGNFARRRRAENPALTVFQRRLLGVEAGPDGDALHHVANHPRTATGGDDGIDARAAGDVGGLQLGAHTAGT